MSPSATMVAGSQRAKAGARRSFLPAVPRAFEKKSDVQQASGPTTPSVASENKDSAGGNSNGERQSGTNDWASLAGEEQVETEASSRSQDVLTPDQQESEVNGSATQKEEVASEPLKHQTPSAPQNKARAMNGSASAFNPDSVMPGQRFEPSIVFGGSVVSGESSPILPPSGSSTHQAHATPLSDTNSTRSHFPKGSNHSQHPSHSNFFHAKPMQPSPSLVPNHQPGLPPQARLDQHYTPVAPRPPMASDNMAIHGPPSEGQALLGYLVTQFNNPEFADCTLEIYVRGQSVQLSLHSVVAARSPRIRSLLMSQMRSKGQHDPKHLVLEATDAFVSIPALVSALRVCYGTSPSASHFISTFPAPPQADERGFLSMEMCLAYLAAGHLLQLNEVATIGLGSAVNILASDNLENFLAFGLAGSLEFFETASPEVYDHSSLRRSTFAPYSDEVVGTGMNFLISRLHPGFQLDVNAPSSEKLGGIPNFKDSADLGHRRLSSNPRLSFIQFGDMQSSSDPESASYSSILLSLPFTILHTVLGACGQPHLAQAVIEERERRRLEYLRRLDSQSGEYEGVLKKKTRAHWEESVDVSVGIARRWVSGE